MKTTPPDSNISSEATETERINLETIAQATIPINSEGEDGRSIVHQGYGRIIAPGLAP